MQMLWLVNDKSVYTICILHDYKMTSIKYITKFLRDRDDISVYEYLLLAALIVVGATVSIIEYFL